MIRKSLTTAVLLVALATLAAPQATARPAFKQVAEVKSPTSLTWAPGSKREIYVTERRGRVRIIRRGKLLERPFLNIRRLIVSDWIEQGLLGIAFPPGYRKSGRFYVHYTARNGDIKIDEFKRNRKRPLTANPNSRRTVLRIPELKDGGGHNGGALAFMGRYLYISVGDGGDPGDEFNQAQDKESLRGKILKIDPRPDEFAGRTYTIPPSNPFVDAPGRDEVFAYGLRNPHSFSFYRDEASKLHLMIADVGQLRYEEINFVTYGEALGANFGWKIYEGLESYNCDPDLCPNGSVGAPPPIAPPGLTWPDVVYSHDDGCAVISGPAIRDPAMGALTGRFIAGDFCANDVTTWDPSSGSLLDRQPLGAYLPPGKGKHPALNGIGEDGWGRVYLFSNYGGVYRLLANKPGKKK
jgi:glucose/arabinose dehydrogenase